MYNKQLDTFIKVAELGSFSKAAKELFITPTAIIKQVNLLEKTLDLVLFIRTHRGLTLTESGKSLYEDAKYIIQYSKDSLFRAKNAADKKENTIRIGTSPITPGQFLVELWTDIHKYCPNIKLQLVTFENTPENAREILKNFGKSIDIVAGIYDEMIWQNRGCRTFELSRVPIRCAVSVHHKLAKKKNLVLADLYGETLMLIHRGWNRHIDKLRDHIIKNHPKINIKDFDFYNTDVFNQCENSNYILMTVDMWKNVHPLLKTLPVEWDYEIPFGLLHAPEPSKIVQSLLNIVKKVIK